MGLTYVYITNKISKDRYERFITIEDDLRKRTFTLLCITVVKYILKNSLNIIPIESLWQHYDVTIC